MSISKKWVTGVFLTLIITANAFGQYTTQYDGGIIVPERVSLKLMIMEGGTSSSDRDWDDNGNILWSMNLKNANGVPSGEMSDYNGIWGGDNSLNDVKRVIHNDETHMVVCGNGNDAVAMFEFDAKKCIFWSETTGTHPHDAEYIPKGNGYIAVADADGTSSFIELYDISGGNDKGRSGQTMDHAGCHTVIWDEKQDCLWAWGSKNLVTSYRFGYTSGGEPKLTEIETFDIDVSGTSPGGTPYDSGTGHGGSPMIVDGKRYLVLGGKGGIVRFDTESHDWDVLQWANDDGSGGFSGLYSNPKGVDFDPVTEEVIFTKSRDTVYSLDVNNRQLSGSEIYKARWWRHQEFSHSTGAGPVGDPNDAQFISQSVPGSLLPGQTATVSITMENTGTDSWTSANAQKLGTQNPQDNSTWTGATRLNLPSDVSPGDQVTFLFDITAPAISGTYDFQWQMVDGQAPNNGWFGDSTPSVSVVVGNTVDLANPANHFDDCGGLQDGKIIGFIHDDSTDTPTARNQDHIWIEYDFGVNYILSSARLYGDGAGGWNSQEWALQVHDGTNYVTVFTNSPCYGTQWYEQALSVTTSKAKVIVNGTTNGTEVFEVEIWGEPENGAPQSGVIAAWDLASGNGTSVPAGWTTWDSSAVVAFGAQNTVNGLTLTHTAGGVTEAKNALPVSTTESATPLLVANAGVLNDYLRVDDTQTLTLSGLTPGQIYKVQLTGNCLTAANGSRNLEIVMDGSTTNLLFATPSTAATNEAAYSEIFNFTASDTDVVFVCNKVGSGASTGVSGLIVESEIVIVNDPPTWGSSPVVKANGQAAVVYSGSLSSDATDPDGDDLIFAKVAGASWLDISSDGTLSGVPVVEGLSTATITVSDGVNPPVPMTLEIMVDAAPLTGYDAWAADNSVDSSDPINLLEYALDGDTTEFGDAEPVLSKNEGVLEYTFKQRNDDPDLSYEVQVCTDLAAGGWTNAGVTGNNLGAEGSYNNMKYTIGTEASQSYVRLKVELQ